MGFVSEMIPGTILRRRAMICEDFWAGGMQRQEQVTLKFSGNVKCDKNQILWKCKLEMCQEDRVRT